jgi:hypothetical protein
MGLSETLKLVTSLGFYDTHDLRLSDDAANEDAGDSEK